jgi:ABC-type transporter MlaC component
MNRHPLYHHAAGLARLFALAVLAAIMAAAPARAQSSCPGEEVVHAAVASLSQAASSGSAQAFSAVFDRHANVSEVAMFALGPYRKAMPSAQRGEYVKLTRAFLGRFLAERAGSLAGARLQVTGCSSDSGYTYLDSRVAGQRVVWRLKGGRIVDVNFGGVWLLPQLRSNFVSVIERGNGDPAALIEYLRSGRSFS